VKNLFGFIHQLLITLQLHNHFGPTHSRQRLCTVCEIFMFVTSFALLAVSKLRFCVALGNFRLALLRFSFSAIHSSDIQNRAVPYQQPLHHN
jgi:hypothetical protein